MKRIVYTQNGGVCVVTPVINLRETLTEDEALARAMAKLPPDAANVRVVEASEIPADRTFRDAWELSNGKVGVSLAKAKTVLTKRLGSDPRIASAKSVDELKALL